MSKGIIGNLQEGKIFVISAPAGTGKSTLARMLCDYFKPHVLESTSCTTREPRKGEKEGREYYFKSKEDFLAHKEKNEFLEWAQVFGHFYGTLTSDVKGIVSQGKHALLVIDTQGAMKLKELIDAVFIFVAPPSVEELETRLRNRKTESDEMINERLEWAQTEFERAELYDYFVVNKKLEDAFEVIKSIIIAEEYKNV